jgi:hypothetical protein
MEDRRRKLEQYDPFAIVDRMAGVNQDHEIIEVPSPVHTDEHGVTWVGSIGMSAHGLIIPDTISQNEWFDFYNVIRNVRISLQYIVGDWFAYGRDNFDYSYEQIAALTGYKESTVETFASVCRSVPQLTRVNSPQFAYARAVAILSPEQQIQALQYAAQNHMSARELYAFIRRKKIAKTSQKNSTKTRRSIVDKVAFNQLLNASEEKRLKAAQQLREMAEALERGGQS